MAEGKWTPGPWHLTLGNLVRVYAMNGRGAVTICGVHRMGRFGGDVSGTPEANGRLIAEAPAMLEALSPLVAAYRAYVSAFDNFRVCGETSADRHASEREREATAMEVAYEVLASISFDQLAAASECVSRVKGEGK